MIQPLIDASQRNDLANLSRLAKDLHVSEVKMHPETGELKKKTQARINAVMQAIEGDKLTYVSIASLEQIIETYKKKNKGKDKKPSPSPKIDVLGDDFDEDLGLDAMDQTQRETFQTDKHKDMQGTRMGALFRRHFSSINHNVRVQGYIHYSETEEGKIIPIAMAYMVGKKEYMLVHRSIIEYPLATWELIKELKKEHEKLMLIELSR